MIQVHKLLENFKSNLLLQVHDEIICEIHKDEMETLPNLIRDVLVENTLRIPLEVDIEICEPSWAVKKDYFKKEESIQEEPVVEVKEKELAYSIDWS
jgi:hypothetical protein